MDLLVGRKLLSNPEAGILGLRIASVFLVLLGGLCGTVPPLFVNAFKSKDSYASLLLRSFSSGSILALALLHIAPDAWEDLRGIAPGYPSLGGACILFGIVFIAISESCSHALLHNHSNYKNMDEGVEEACPRRLSLNPEEKKSIKYMITAYIFEFGCILHSIVIGISLGVITDDIAKVVSLMIALIFHQMIEGISVGNMVIRANFPLRKSLIMAVAYSITTPIGIIIGIGISESYDENSVKARIIQGAFNGVAAGMLLYICLVQLIAEDFINENELLSSNWKLAGACYGLFILGAAFMALLALWA